MKGDQLSINSIPWWRLNEVALKWRAVLQQQFRLLDLVMVMVEGVDRILRQHSRCFWAFQKVLNRKLAKHIGNGPVTMELQMFEVEAPKSESQIAESSKTCLKKNLHRWSLIQLFTEKVVCHQFWFDSEQFEVCNCYKNGYQEIKKEWNCLQPTVRH